MACLVATPAFCALLYVIHRELSFVESHSRFAPCFSLDHLVDSISQPAPVAVCLLFQVLVLRPRSELAVRLLNHTGWKIFKQDVALGQVEEEDLKVVIDHAILVICASEIVEISEIHKHIGDVFRFITLVTLVTTCISSMK